MTPFVPAPADAARTEAFSARIAGTLNQAALALMISVGHRTGLFDAMSAAGPSTSAGLAARARLDERYVREWLGAMTTGGVAEYDPATATYRLPAEHAASLTRSAAPNNLAAIAQYVAVLGSVEDRIVECFRRGGGVPYAAFPRFQEVMAEDSGQTVLPALFDAILPIVPGLPARLDAGIDVLDVGCGSGRAILAMARRFPRSRFTGVDLSAQGIASARAEAVREGIANARFEVRDATADDGSRFDLVTAFDAVHDQADPAGLLARVASSLRDGGVFLMQDIRASARVERNLDHPLGTFLYTISCMHCMTVSLAEGGAGLGTCWGVETAERMLADAGFANVVRRDLPHDLQNTYYVARKR